MPSSATPRGRLEKQGSGENSNTWGHIKLNGVLDLLDEQIDGIETIALTVSPTTLTTTNYASDQQRNKAYRFTGTGAFTVNMPAVEWVKLFINATTGTLTVSNGTNSTTIATGKSYWVASDGTNLFKDTTAEDAAAAAATSATNAATSATNSANSATASANSATNSANSATSSATGATNSANSATASANSATTAAGLVTTASNWAQKTDGTVDGTGFSAKYWAGQASAVTGIPTLSGNSGKFLTNDGTAMSWGVLGAMATRGKGTAAQVYALTADVGLTADVLGSAFGGVALTDAATITFDWAAGYYRTLTATAAVGTSRALGNPTNVIPGSTRILYVVGGDTTARSLTFGTNFKNPPSITDLTTTKGYAISVFAVSATHLVPISVRAL